LKVCPNCQSQFEATDWRCPRCHHEPPRLNGFVAFAPDLAEENESYSPEFFQTLADLQAASFWFRARNRLIVWALRRHFPTARSFLEVGCGTGFVIEGIRAALPGLTITGSEIYTTGLEFARRRLGAVDLLQLDASALPYSGEFDVIGAFDVLEHIEADQIVLQQMYQAARPGGGIILTVPQHMALWSMTDEHARHVRRYAAAELASKVSAAGFDVLRATSFVSLLLPLMAVSRRQLQREGEDRLLSELSIGGLLNSLFEATMTLERLLIERGVSFPIGGSLLLVARKL